MSDDRKRLVRPPSGGDPAGRRTTSARLKTAKERSASSQAWLERQLSDPFVVAARARKCSSRSGSTDSTPHGSDSTWRPGRTRFVSHGLSHDTPKAVALLPKQRPGGL